MRIITIYNLNHIKSYVADKQVLLWAVVLRRINIADTICRKPFLKRLPGHFLLLDTTIYSNLFSV